MSLTSGEKMGVVEEALQDALMEHKSQPWKSSKPVDGVVASRLYLGATHGQHFEVATAHADSRPTKAVALDIWKARHGGRASACVVVLAYEEHGKARATVVGPDAGSPVTHTDLSFAGAVVSRALEAETREEAVDIVVDLHHENPDDAHPGLANKGLFAWHSLTERVPAWVEWSTSREAARSARGKSGDSLLKALGWDLQAHGEVSILRDGIHPQGIAVLLTPDEAFDRPSLKYGLGTSPVEHAISVARREGVRWVIAVQGPRLRLYPADSNASVARAGIATYAQLNVDLLSDDDLAYMALLFTPAALSVGGSVERMLEDSKAHAADLGTRLRERIYADVVGGLATLVANRIGDRSEQGLQQAYHVTLVILFRLLFVAYAEDRRLLPYEPTTSGQSNAYTHKALKTRAIRYADEASTGDLAFDTASTSVWDDMRQIWEAVYHGNLDWGLPAYGGNLFRDDTETGRQIKALALTNAEFGPLLVKLLVDTGIDGTDGPVDFASLSVREFGTIYEGLLESSLSVAPSDLALDKSDAFVPAKEGQDVEVAEGEIYFHNSSGARKATGSYFTKAFAVEHLLESALDPTLAEHLERIKGMLDEDRQADAADALFDFRVADIAMGSGHFLVGAATHIADAIEDFLAEHPIPLIAKELESLRQSARARLEAAGVAADDVDITNTDLILRQVAKRCIYGVDVNDIAVDLARLGLWIHTFVPGLPMSALDHGLVSGNSLTGIASLHELLGILEPGGDGGATSLFYDDLVDALGAADVPLARAARLAEADLAESEEAERLHSEARAAIAPVRTVMDAAIASRLEKKSDIAMTAAQGWDALVERGSRENVCDVVERLDPLHFPVAFPEVFRAGRVRPGFDVVLGNPPWEKVKVEKHAWYGLRFPGLRSMSQKDKNAKIEQIEADRPDLVAEYEAEILEVEALRAVLKAGPYPAGSGDTDLYKIFCWRDWDVLREGGRAGVVFPRGALSGSGTAAWRAEILEHGAFDDVCFLTNSRQWVFDEVHPQYTVALTTVRRGGSNTVTFNGPFHSLAEYRAGVHEQLTVEAEEFTTWATGASFPLLPSNDSAEVFRQLRRSPRFDSAEGFEFRPHRELDATNDKALMDFDLDNLEGRVPVLAGASFNLWDPDFGQPYASADPDDLKAHLLSKLQRQTRTSSSAFYGLDADEGVLPINRSRIAFRDIARATDTRTAISCLLPPGVAVTHKAPYLVRRSGDSLDEAYLLAVMSSVLFDWYSRRYVEVNLTFEVLAPMPVPRPDASDLVRVRLVELAGTLAAVDERYSDWAAEVGVPVGGLSGDAKDDAIAEIDALVSHLYGLSRDQVEVVFSTFHRGWDYATRLSRVLDHYDAWADRASHHHDQTTEATA